MRTQSPYYISGGWIFPGGKLPDASRPPVSWSCGGESHPRPVYDGAVARFIHRHERIFRESLPCRGVGLFFARAWPCV
ncbi:MAG: hypothetical protein ACQESR_18990 [Planctomycetota bacterium]